MNYRMFVFVVLVVGSLLGGCETTKQLGRDSMAVFNRPETAGIVLAVLGGAVDRNVLNGNGQAGALVGGAVGYALGKERQAQQRDFVESATRCRVSQSGYYDGTNSFVVTSETRVCDSGLTNPGFRTYPDQGVTVRYEVTRGAANPQTTSGAGNSICERYADGKVNHDCRR